MPPPIQSAWIPEHLPYIRNVRQQKGWRPTTLDSGSFCARCMCVVAELNELEEALGKWSVGDDPIEGDVAVECADVALYLIIILDDLYPALLKDVRPDSTYHINPHRLPEQLTGTIRQPLVKAWEKWRRDEHGEMFYYLKWALESVMYLAAALRIDLGAAVRRKTEKNALRPFQHGGKHPDT